jgi:hypothetical protein
MTTPTAKTNLELADEIERRVKNLPYCNVDTQLMTNAAEALRATAAAQPVAEGRLYRQYITKDRIWYTEVASPPPTPAGDTGEVALTPSQQSGAGEVEPVARAAMEEIATRASNLADVDAAEWMPSIYSIAMKALGDDPEPFLKATGFDGEPKTWPTRRARAAPLPTTDTPQQSVGADDDTPVAANEPFGCP